jgi:hypothetical protein
MNYPIKLALLILSLGAAGVQAAPSIGWSGSVAIVDAPAGGTLVKEMTTEFGNASSSGELHSAVYDYGHAGVEVYYQITNNAWSTGAITDLGQNGNAAADASTWWGQTSAAFGSFVAGTVKADSAQLWLSGPKDSNGLFTKESVLMTFAQPGIAPGQSSYTGAVYSNCCYVHGTVFVDGQSVETLVSAVPEPQEYALLLAGLGLFGVVARRRKSKQDAPVTAIALDGAFA